MVEVFGTSVVSRECSEGEDHLLKGPSDAVPAIERELGPNR